MRARDSDESRMTHSFAQAPRYTKVVILQTEAGNTEGRACFCSSGSQHMVPGIAFISLTWELVRYANSQDLTPSVESGALAMGHSNPFSQALWGTLMFDRI